MSTIMSKKLRWILWSNAFSDTSLFANVFENLRHKFIEIYELYSAHF